MKIICPQCQFERDIDISTIPSSATTATCPKCGEKFTFRSKLKDYSDSTPKGAHIPDLTITKANPEDSKEKEAPQEKQETKRNNDSHSTAHKNEFEQKTLTQKEFEEKLKHAYQSYQRTQGSTAFIPPFMTMVPWEMPDNSLSLFQKFAQTILRALFSAPAFFATMFRPFSMSKAALFYIIIGLLQFLVRMLIFQFSAQTPLMDDPNAQALIEVMMAPSTLFLGMLISPIVLVIQLMAISGILFLIIKLIEPRSADFSLITRMIAYASAPGLLSIIPFLGDIISIPWIIFNILLGCRLTLNMSLLKVFLTLLAFCLFSLLLLLYIVPSMI